VGQGPVEAAVVVAAAPGAAEQAVAPGEVVGLEHRLAGT
jgi:hypothetical protein